MSVVVVGFVVVVLVTEREVVPGLVLEVLLLLFLFCVLRRGLRLVLLPRWELGKRRLGLRRLGDLLLL